jgi:hypothetical protein
MGDGRDVSVQVRTDRDGAVIDVTGNAKPGGGAVTAYLLDLAHAGAPVQALELRWDTPAQGFVAAVTVEASDDLSHWRSVLRGAMLADLSYGEHRLRRDRIELSPTRGRYLRVTWPPSLQGVTLTAVQVVLAPTVAEAPPHWRAAAGHSDPAEPGEYQFDAGGRFPVDRARLRFPQRNTVVQVTLLSRARADGPWVTRYAGLQYSLDLEGGLLESELPQWRVVSDRYWRLRVDLAGGGLGSGMPELSLRWTPQRLVFVARGEPPYTLAYGSASATASRAALSGLLQQLGDGARLLQPAAVGSALELGGPTALLPPPPPLPWKQWLLWAALILAVLAVAWMTARLYRQMNP